MNSRFAALMPLILFVLLMLLAVSPVMNVLASPAPDPYALLDIGPPPRGKTAAQHLKDQIAFLTSLDTLNKVLSDSEVRQLLSVAVMEDARPWLAKNLRSRPEDGKRLLRLTFRAGKRDEQVAIINGFLRARLLQLPQGLDDALVWNPQDGSGDSSLASNWYDRTIGRQLEDDEPGPGPSTPIILDGTPNRTTSKNAPITWDDSVIPRVTIRKSRPKQYSVIRWAR